MSSFLFFFIFGNSWTASAFSEISEQTKSEVEIALLFCIIEFRRNEKRQQRIVSIVCTLNLFLMFTIYILNICKRLASKSNVWRDVTNCRRFAALHSSHHSLTSLIFDPYFFGNFYFYILFFLFICTISRQTRCSFECRQLHFVLKKKSNKCSFSNFNGWTWNEMKLGGAALKRRQISHEEKFELNIKWITNSKTVGWTQLRWNIVHCALCVQSSCQNTRAHRTHSLRKLCCCCWIGKQYACIHYRRRARNIAPEWCKWHENCAALHSTPFWLLFFWMLDARKFIKFINS